VITHRAEQAGQVVVKRPATLQHSAGVVKAS